MFKNLNKGNNCYEIIMLYITREQTSSIVSKQFTLSGKDISVIFKICFSQTYPGGSSFKASVNIVSVSPFDNLHNVFSHI